MIEGAKSYLPARDTWIVTSYFNPSNYATKRDNYERFMAAIRAGGVNCITVECAFGDQKFSLEPGPTVLQIRCDAVLWQKERLLNYAIERLPPACTKVVWLDCDILFVEADWVVKTSRALDTYAVVQPFEYCYRLPRGHDAYAGQGQKWRGFASVYAEDPSNIATRNFTAHGHTGFGWAARRDVLDEHGLHDVDIAGSADHLMAHAAIGDWGARCARRICGVANAYATEFREWSRAFYARVQGRLGVVEGDILHLWHGETVKRQYEDRHRELIIQGYDPKTDIRIGSSGAWEWASDKPELHAWGRRYFELRREDG